ncbi:MAG: HNH endonuclease [Nitrosomonas sp.]|uniref:HNH endonuclease n=1 Tax=Nitrosomonas sp. TaxID=42353 RepID=UPI0032ED21F0
MNIFVVRLNPDTRDTLPYTEYPVTRKEIIDAKPMNGFFEAVNFKSEKGVIRGYLPPKHLTSMRDGKLFALITITAKTATRGGDMIMGIQAGCKYIGETPRVGANNIRKLGLTWHYTCPESLSLLLEKPIRSARDIILEDNDRWVRGPTFKLNKIAAGRVLEKIESSFEAEENRKKYKNIVDSINNRNIAIAKDLEVKSSFEDEVKDALSSDLSNVIGNKTPFQKEIQSFQYVRDPRVVAYVLKHSKGICQDCKKEGPFISKMTGLPYLEVHHKKMLKDGGEDTIANAIALCPNCHRKRHYS